MYKDADRLEHLLHSRVRTLAPIDDSAKSTPRRYSKVAVRPNVTEFLHIDTPVLPTASVRCMIASLVSQERDGLVV